MRLFQHFEIYEAYDARLRSLAAGAGDYAEKIRTFLSDRYEALHLLLPVLRADEEAFLSSGSTTLLQQTWAREQGMKAGTPLIDILLAQIEAHRTEVFYDLAPARFGDQLLRRLPATVKVKVAWHAAPLKGIDLGCYDLVVCNFPSILASYRQSGWRTAFFYPAYDPEMHQYAENSERPIDLLFVGTYSRHHLKRAELLEAFARVSREVSVRFFLNCSRFTKMAESLAGRVLPLGNYRRPREVREVAQLPVFGRDLYRAISNSKIVLNGAIDMAGSDRGNLRCFEAMGCGALLYSDEGIYPEGMVAEETMLTYRSVADALQGVQSILEDVSRLRALALAGNAMLRSRYSKEKQWDDFVRLTQ